MRLKYKKLIIMITLAIMLIGMGTFSMIAPKVDFSLGGSTADTATGSALSTMSEEDIETEIVTLVKNYYDAKQEVDMDRLQNYVSDISHVDEKQLVTEAEYIEEYKNIECTILDDGLPEGTYRVYVYCEAKVYDIDTLIPSLNGLYVTITEEGSFVVYLSAIDGDVQEAINELDSSEQIKKKIDTVQKKLQEIVSKNADVRDFHQMLESSQTEDSTENNQNIGSEGTANTPAPAN